jgi:hypothetical protein
MQDTQGYAVEDLNPFIVTPHDIPDDLGNKCNGKKLLLLSGMIGR